jgi:hypothetical protein
MGGLFYTRDHDLIIIRMAYRGVRSFLVTRVLQNQFNIPQCCQHRLGGMRSIESSPQVSQTLNLFNMFAYVIVAYEVVR